MFFIDKKSIFANKEIKHNPKELKSVSSSVDEFKSKLILKKK